MKKPIFRIIAGSLGSQHLQFKSKSRFLFWEFDVWRYLPDCYVANCFKETDCPYWFLPFPTSHCFASSWSAERLEKYASTITDISSHLKSLKDKKEKVYSTKYL